MNAKGLAHRLGECAAMGSVRGYWDAEKAESILADALAEKDKEIARMREAAERVVMFSPSDGAANNYIYVEHAMLCRSLRGGECDCDMGEFMKAMDDLESALLPPAEKEEPHADA